MTAYARNSGQSQNQGGIKTVSLLPQPVIR
jgi:hypothetical protein